MNRPNPIRTPHSAFRTGFTLIELLVVVAIIGILAGLIVGMASVAGAKKSQSLAQAQLAAMETAIDSYHKAKGFYPPDNPNDPTLTQNALFYELTGTMVMFTSKSVAPDSYYSSISGETLTTNQIFTLFGTMGFMNCSNSSENVSVNFYPGLRVNQHEQFATNGINYTLLGVGVSGPLQLQPVAGGANPFLLNPWHYNVSHPTNNVDSYDLWIDVKYSGKTNRICNWSKDPIVVSY